ncbi:MAG TPA: TonB-dependent receptor, partial [Phenylobacterium sp.]|nr:TonB-dependent receptor [Phenylobacterium sp.]
PFFVSPIGAASHQIDYAFQGELANPQVSPVTESFSGAAGFKLQLPAAWLLEGYGGLGQEHIASRTTGLLNSAFLNEALGAVPDNPLTAYRAASDGYFNPFTGQPANAAAVLAFIGSGRSETKLRNQVFSGGLQADGPLIRLPAGEVKLAVGVQARRETYARSGVNFTSTVTPTAQQSLKAERDMAAAYAELNAPLVGPENRRPGVEQLELTAAIRAERYSDFGSTVNPKIGLIWSPLEGVRWKATYGESFRAPALTELSEAEVYTPLRLQDVSGQVLTLALNGGNRDLEPETAKSWTVTLEVAPPHIPGLQASLSAFRTTFESRIDRPLFSNRLTALTDPTLAGFVQRLDPQDPADLALITRLLADPRTLTSLGVFPPTDYRAITDFRYVNTGRLQVSGLDVQAAYARPAFGGRLTLAVNGAWLFDYKQQVTPLAPAVEYVGQAGYPAKFRVRTSAEWTRGRLTLGGALIHTAGFTDALGAKIDAQTKVDTHLRISAPETGGLAGLSLSLVVRNLFDQPPPFYDNLTGIGFDPASGDPVGRFIAVELAKRW